MYHENPGFLSLSNEIISLARAEHVMWRYHLTSLSLLHRFPSLHIQEHVILFSTGLLLPEPSGFLP